MKAYDLVCMYTPIGGGALQYIRGYWDTETIEHHTDQVLTTMLQHLYEVTGSWIGVWACSLDLEELDA